MNERLATLYDYTKFHIGFYITLFSAIVALVELDDFVPYYPSLLLKTAAVFLALAGMAGGIICTNILLHGDDDVWEFYARSIGPWESQGLEARSVVRFEHSCFWIAVLCGLMALWLRDL